MLFRVRKKACLMDRPVESKTRTYRGRVGSGCTAKWRGAVDQDWMPTEEFALEISLFRIFKTSYRQLI